MSKTIIYNSFPPLLKVSGENIRVLLELDSKETVKKRLQEWGISVKDGYVLTDDILNRFRNISVTTTGYNYTYSNTSSGLSFKEFKSGDESIDNL
ncbi:hypothetical protein [Ekhidna sp.]|uniref:hypothetical protein n=1 Tax=Ekhidna sp. TaxID=2608089 RepID=UPI003BAD2B02